MRPDSISTITWWTGCSAPASPPSSRCTTGTCPRRCRIRAVGPTRPCRRLRRLRRHRGPPARRPRPTLDHPQRAVGGGVCGQLPGPPRASGVRDLATALRVAHNLLLSHGRAVPRLRAAAPGAQVGITLNFSTSRPASDSAADAHATRLHDQYVNRWFLQSRSSAAGLPLPRRLNAVPGDRFGAAHACGARRSRCRSTSWGSTIPCPNFVRPGGEPRVRVIVAAGTWPARLRADRDGLAGRAGRVPRAARPTRPRVSARDDLRDRKRRGVR